MYNDTDIAILREKLQKRALAPFQEYTTLVEQGKGRVKLSNGIELCTLRIIDLEENISEKEREELIDLSMSGKRVVLVLISLKDKTIPEQISEVLAEMVKYGCELYQFDLAHKELLRIERTRVATYDHYSNDSIWNEE